MINLKDCLTDLRLEWKKKYRLIIILSLFSVGVFLRIYNLGAESLWLDEVVSVNIAQDNIIRPEQILKGDIHLPLYYLLLHFWTSIFGISDLIVRLPSAIFGAFAVLVIYKLGKTLFGVESGVYSALFLAVSTFNIKYSREARMYSLVTVTTLLSMFFLIRFLQASKLKFLVGYVIGTIIMLLSHYYSLFTLLFQIFIVLLYPHKTKHMMKRYAVAQLIIVLFFLPWLSNVFGLVSAIMVGQLAWIPAMNLNFIVDIFFKFCNGSVVHIILFSTLALGEYGAKN